jgi:hypothetical protein
LHFASQFDESEFDESSFARAADSTTREYQLCPSFSRSEPMPIPIT